jgi:hypothetical protein
VSVGSGGGGELDGRLLVGVAPNEAGAVDDREG